MWRHRPRIPAQKAEEVEWLQTPGCPCVLRKFQASLGYTLRCCLKQTNVKQQQQKTKEGNIS